MASKYLASQISGTLAQAVIGVQEYDYAQKDNALNYYRNISIDTALPNDLMNLGYWIGLPWPTASTLLITGNMFTFGSSATYPQYTPTIGFGTVNNTAIGGLFSSTNPTDITYIPVDKYRSLLRWFAWFKRNGFTLESIDMVASIFSNDYTIEYVSFNTFTLASGTVTTSDPLKGLAPADLSSGGHFAAGNSWDINLHFTTTIGAGNVYVLQYIFDRILDTQRVNVSQAV